MKAEQQLVHDIQNGNRTAMRRLYDQYSEYAMATALRYVPDKDNAADIVQDAFVHIFSSIGKYEYRGEGMLRSWLTRVVVNEALCFLRHGKGLVFTSDIPDITADEDPDMSLISDRRLAELIASLPEGYRVVLNMFVFGGMSHREIADELGITPSTSASQFFRAKNMLARMIKNEARKESI